MNNISPIPYTVLPPYIGYGYPIAIDHIDDEGTIWATPNFDKINGSDMVLVDNDFNHKSFSNAMIGALARSLGLS